MRRIEDERGDKAHADFWHWQPNPHQLICESYVPVEKTTGKPFMLERMAKSLA
jgi:hypothetical protein